MGPVGAFMLTSHTGTESAPARRLKKATLATVWTCTLQVPFRLHSRLCLFCVVLQNPGKFTFTLCPVVIHRICGWPDRVLSPHIHIPVHLHVATAFAVLKLHGFCAWCIFGVLHAVY